jgi:hypothetical protein
VTRSIGAPLLLVRGSQWYKHEYFSFGKQKNILAYTTVVLL